MSYRTGTLAAAAVTLLCALAACQSGPPDTAAPAPQPAAGARYQAAYQPPACFAQGACSCKDFRTPTEAQRFFEWAQRETGVRDRFGLDADHDEVACEALTRPGRGR